ncbi:MAG TPA: hypothetical protein DHV12_04725 [Thermotogae bacterium]|nr:hypothetical protein [Thermotogota bacterium]
MKSRPEKYPRATGVKRNVWPEVEKSITVIKNAEIPYELRMVRVPGLVDEEDIQFLKELGKKVSGAKITINPFQTTDRFMSFVL